MKMSPSLACSLAGLLALLLMDAGLHETNAQALTPAQERALDSGVRRETASDAEAQRARRDAARARTARLPQTQAATDPLAPAAGGPCFTIRHVKISGYEVFGQFPQGYRDLIGRCSTAAEIAATLNRINTAYQARGFITTRAYVPEQNVADGELEIVVIPGLIEGYVYGDGRKADRRLAAAFPTGRGDLLNLRDLEQGLDNINAVRSAKAKFQLVPGEKTGGSFVQVIATDGRRMRASLETRNSGFETTGEVKTTATAEFDNLAWLNDQTTISLTTTPFDPRGKRFSDALALNTSVPWGNWSFGLDAGLSRYFFILDGVNQTYPVEGHTAHVAFSVERLLMRDQTTKSYAYGEMKVSASRSSIDGFEIESQHRDMTIGTLGLRGEKQLPSGKFTWDLGLKAGLGLISHTPVKSSVDENFTLFFATFNYEHPLCEGLIYRGSLSGQLSNDVLPSSEQFSIGGWGNVRGFHDDSMYGDSGIYLRNSLEWTAFQGDDLTLKLEPGIDFGLIKPSLFRDWDQHHLIGASLGARVAYQDRINLDFRIAQALDRPSDFEAGRTVAYAGINLKF